MSTKHNVFIQHACMFTREGIKLTLNSPRNMFRVIADVANLEVRACRVLDEQDVNIFILELQTNSASHGNILDFIMEWLPQHYPDAKVVIMAQTYAIGRLKDYLLGLGNVAAVLDNGISRQELLAHLKRIIAIPAEMGDEKRRVIPLTHQEIKVLGHLLKGMPVLKVASVLNINQKTVSSHKRAAMNKLGVTSLHGLMRCKINLNMMGNLFNNKSHVQDYK